jgi:hypothetical protein
MRARAEGCAECCLRLSQHYVEAVSTRCDRSCAVEDEHGTGRIGIVDYDSVEALVSEFQQSLIGIAARLDF